jgi:hypothetical protein
MKTFTSFTLALILLAVTACSGSGELTRELAASKIEQSVLARANGSYSMAPFGFDRGTTQGYWNPEGALTERGQAIFTSVSRTSIAPKTPPTFLIQVTGITDAPSPAGAKEVQFTLSNNGASGPVRRFIISGGTGTAIFRKFDDGWRIENVRFQGLQDGLQLSASEAQSMREEQEAELSRRQRIYQQATTPTTRTVYTCQALSDYGPETRTANVTDVSIELSSVNRQPGRVILYKDIREINVYPGYETPRLGVDYGWIFDICPGAAQIGTTLRTRLNAWRARWSGVRLSY